MDEELFWALVADMKKAAQSTIADHDQEIDGASIGTLLGALGYLSANLIALMPADARRTTAEEYMDRFHETTAVRQ